MKSLLLSPTRLRLGLLIKSMPMRPEAATHPEHGEGHWITVRGHHIYVPLDKDGKPGREIKDATDKAKSGHLVGKKLDANDHRRLLENTGHAERRAPRTANAKLEGDRKKLERVRTLAKNMDTVWDDVKRDLALGDHDERRVRAAVLALMLKANLRVGNEESSAYGVHGATTLPKECIKVKGNVVKLEFKGKSQVDWKKEIHDAALAKALKYYCDTAEPGEPIFQYRTPKGLKPMKDTNIREAVNKYGVVPKDLRTYAASSMAFHALKAASVPDGEKLSKKEIVQRMKDALTPVAEQMSHELSMCMNNYIAPAIMRDFVENGGRLSIAEPKYDV